MSSSIGLGRRWLEECPQGVGLSKLDGGVVLKKSCKKEGGTWFKYSWMPLGESLRLRQRVHMMKLLEESIIIVFMDECCLVKGVEGRVAGAVAETSVKCAPFTGG